MTSALNFWKHVSIAKKLYLVFGVMAFLIVSELVVLGFALSTLSAVRAFVAGEGSWSKAQKNAMLSFQRYTISRDPAEFQNFLDHLKIPDGDRQARVQLESSSPDVNLVRAGFIAGRVHPDDIDGMVNLLRRFHWISYIKRSMAAWAGADATLEKFYINAQEFRAITESPKADPERLAQLLNSNAELNRQLTELEDEFSDALGEGSRWLEEVVVFLLFLAVLSVEAIGLTLTFLTSRSITQGLDRIAKAADAIGQGKFSQRIAVDSRDEIGHLAEAVNRMGSMLQQSYGELERRVHLRTIELERAVKTRDDFLSIASHELKTPLTSWKLHIQMRRRALEKGSEFDLENLKKMVNSDEKQLNRITHLIDDMLDISRLNQGKFTLTREHFDLGALVADAVDRFSVHFREAGIELRLETAGSVFGDWDFFRAEQAFTNLLTNALKYGRGRPVQVSVKPELDFVRITVKDEGEGIDTSDQERVFRQFERAAPKTHVAGLGLGLYIVQEIMKAHGGRVELVSELGRGAAFSLFFPLERPQ